MTHVVLGLLQQLFARLRPGHAGGPLELAHRRVLGRLQLVLQRPGVDLAVVDALLAAGQLGGLLVELFVAGAATLLGSRHLAAAQLELLLRLLTHTELELHGLELGLLAKSVGVALCVFEQRLGLQSVGLSLHSGELLLQEESDRSAYEKRRHDGDHEDVHETTSFPRTWRGMSDPAADGATRRWEITLRKAVQKKRSGR